MSRGDGTSTFGYDGFGRLNRVTLPDGRIGRYRYDGLGRRTALTIDGQLTRRFVYGAGVFPQARVDAAGEVLERYIFGSYGHVPDLIVRRDGQRIRLITDALGSVRAAIDADTGTILQRISYDAFGRQTQNTEPGLQPFGYKGALTDPVAEGAGLMWMGVRAYTYTLARFITPDPLGLSEGWNEHDALRGDPVNLSDPLGTSVASVANNVSAVAGGVATVAGGVAAVCAVGLAPTVAGVGLCAPAAALAVGAGAVAVVADIVAAVAGEPDPASLVLDGLGLVTGGIVGTLRRVPGAVDTVIDAISSAKDELLNVFSSLKDLADFLYPDDDPPNELERDCAADGRSK